MYLAETESMISEQIAALTQMYLEGEQQTKEPEPLVMLKNRELDLRAMELQNRAQTSMMDMQRKSEEFDEKIDLEKMKREDAEAASNERIRVADEKLDLAEMKIRNDMERKNEGQKTRATTKKGT